MSSPPITSTPFHHRLPTASSPVESQYSIDFNALSREDDGIISSPIPGRLVKQIRSEDIDGPSDFTLNMERWMRGSLPHARRDSKDKSISATRKLSSSSETQSKSQHASIDIVESATDQQTQNNDSDIRQSQKKQDDSPQQKPQNPLLQPTVEDYASEVIPARPVSSIEASESTVVPDNVSAASRVSKSQSSALYELHSQLAELRQRLDESQRSNNTLQHRISESEKLAKAQATEIAGNKRALAEANSARQAADAESKKLKTQLDEMCDSEDSDLHNLRCQVRELKSALTIQETRVQDADELEADLAALKLEKAASETMYKGRIAILESQVQSQAATTSSGSTTEIETLKESLATAQADRLRLETELEAAVKEADLLRDLSKLDDIPIVLHEPNPTTSKDVPEELQKALQQANSDLETLKAQNFLLTSDKTTLSSRLTALETSISTLASEKVDLLEIIAGQETRISSITAEMGTLREANEAFDARVAVAVKRREEHWRAKERMWTEEMEKTARERTFMAKALMRQWGREECGIAVSGERQKFVYKYAGMRC